LDYRRFLEFFAYRTDKEAGPVHTKGETMHRHDCILLLLLVVSGMACRGTQREQFSRLEGELRETFHGPDADCRKPRNIDPLLQNLLNDYAADAQTLGPHHYPLARLAQIRTLIFVPLGASELQNDAMRMGLNRRVECYDGARAYHIYIVDPATTPERHRLRGL
jgi:hypothetical protein